MSQSKTYPIILAHGACRIEDMSNRLLHLDNVEDDRLHYFRGIRSMLRGHGFDVRHSRVRWSPSVKTRAKSLRRNVEAVLAETGAEKVHVIAHSMGGLDTRHMLFDARADGLHRRVASLSTIGTPHWGSSFADWGLDHLKTLEGLMAPLGLDVEIFDDLRTESCAAFNARAERFEAGCGVLFQTYAGTKSIRYMFTPLKPSAYVIRRREGENDGLVSLRSARWRDEHFRQSIDADHLNLIGWWTAEELLRAQTPAKLEARIRNFYLKIADDLAERFAL